MPKSAQSAQKCPSSKLQLSPIDHIIATMFCVQSRHESQVCFLISGDFNKVSTQDVLESNGALHQICSVATRNSATLELIITDMATLFHPPTTQEPFKEDKSSKGKPSDHNVIIVAPKSNTQFKIKRHNTKIHVRPQPRSKVIEYMREIGLHSWPEVFETEDPHYKAQKFHTTLVSNLEKHLKTKIVNITSVDKPWFNPSLKLKYNEMQKEYFKHGKSARWDKLRCSFRAHKKRASKEFYSNFVNKMKLTQPS